MKATCGFRAVARRGLLLLGFLAGLFCAVGADEPNDKAPDGPPAPQIVKPYVKGQMPEAEELLAKCIRALHEADRWTARITLRAAAPDRPAAESYGGTLVADDDRLHASLHSSTDGGEPWWLLVSDKQALAWCRRPSADGSAAGADADARRAGFERAATAINLLGVVGQLPGAPGQLSEITKVYQFSNQGVAKAAIGQCYVLAATRKPDAEGPASQEKFLIGISVADSRPTAVTAQSADGSWRSITFESIDLMAADDQPAQPDKPPAGAIVVNLRAERAPTAGLKNPIPFGPESIARGKRLYQADCVVCHSIDGTGRDSDVTDNAADLTDTTHWLSDGSEAATFLAIRDGTGDEMPGYADEYGDDKKIWDLVNYIRSLQKQK